MVGSGVVVKRGVSVAVGVKVGIRVAVAAATATCGVGRFPSASREEKTLHPTREKTKTALISSHTGYFEDIPVRISFRKFRMSEIIL